MISYDFQTKITKTSQLLYGWNKICPKLFELDNKQFEIY